MPRRTDKLIAAQSCGFLSTLDIEISVNPMKRSVIKARNVVVVHSERKDPPDLTKLARALIEWKLEEARAKQTPKKKTKPDQ